LLAPSPTQADRLLAECFHFLLHIDSTRRLRLNLNLLGATDRSLDNLPLVEKRMIEMLTFRLLQSEARQPECEWSAGIQRLRMSGSAKEELQELSEVLLDRVRLHADEIPVLDDCPLFLHRQYMRDEVLVGLGMPELVGARHTQAGRFWIEAINTEIFFVTLDKSDKAFSPSTRYEDFAVSRVGSTGNRRAPLAKTRRLAAAMSARRRMALDSCSSSGRNEATHLSSSGRSITFRTPEVVP
jgi:hypothetical protein